MLAHGFRDPLARVCAGGGDGKVVIRAELLKQLAAIVKKLVPGACLFKLFVNGKPHIVHILVQDSLLGGIVAVVRRTRNARPLARRPFAFLHEQAPKKLPYM